VQLMNFSIKNTQTFSNLCDTKILATETGINGAMCLPPKASCDILKDSQLKNKAKNGANPDALVMAVNRCVCTCSRYV